MVNTGDVATATLPDRRAGACDYAGDTEISGVPGTAAPVVIDFPAGARTRAAAHRQRPRRHRRRHGDLRRQRHADGPDRRRRRSASPGTRAPADLEADPTLAAGSRAIRLAAGELMGLGDVVRRHRAQDHAGRRARATAARSTTRTFIPVRVHTSIGVLGAVSVATGLRSPGGVGADLARPPAGATGSASSTPPVPRHRGRASTSTPAAPRLGSAAPPWCAPPASSSTAPSSPGPPEPAHRAPGGHR